MRIAIGSDEATELITTPTDTGEAQSDWTLRQIRCVKQLKDKYGGRDK